MVRDVSRQPNVGKIAMIVGRMLDGFGGIDRFCAAWHCAIAESKKLRPGGRIAFNHFHAIARLVQYVAEHRPNVEYVSDEELESALANP
jgi:hypothetical protein